MIARILPVLLAISLLAATACDDSSAVVSRSTVEPGPTAEMTRLVPPPVEVSPEPQGVTLADPAFEALPGARAEFGRLGGAVYRIELPDEWNGRLVLYMHGFQGLAPAASVDSPFFRSYLIRNGYAWGASSYSSTALIPGRAADETAALWDHFVSEHGRPERTYVTGHSMGGAATHIAAERYGDRFDGALGVCGFAGQTAQARIVTDWFFAGAYAAGVTQQEFEASDDINELTYGRIAPALNETGPRETFEDILVSLTGGPRAFDREGIHAEELTNWTRSSILVPFRLGMNAGREYTFAPGSTVSEASFEDGVVRLVEDEEQMVSFINGNEATGALQMPLLTLHTTGDWQVPIDQQILLREVVEAAGRGDLLVQRAIRDAGHCSTTATEWEAAFEDLVTWVEDGSQPAGEVFVSGSLADAGARFTLSPRFGDSAAGTVAGADQRVTLTGAVTLDGAPMAGRFFWLEVHDNGLRTACSFPGEEADGDGVYVRTIASAAEVPGCGRAGANVYAVTARDGQVRYAGPVPWPDSGGVIQADLAFVEPAASGIVAEHTTLYGTVLDASGRHVPQGATVEAFVGDTLCGVSALTSVEMDFLGADRYDLLIAGPDSVAGCDFDELLTIRVDGVAVAATAAHDRGVHELDLMAH